MTPTPVEMNLHDDVVLRSLRPEDAAALAEAYRVNSEYLAPFEPLRPANFTTEAGQRTEIAALTASREAGTALPSSSPTDRGSSGGPRSRASHAEPFRAATSATGSTRATQVAAS